MIKIVANWTAPSDEDREEFERAYWGVHVPLAENSPGLRKMVLTRVTAGVEGVPPPFYRVAELYWDDEEALRECEASDEWKAVREDAGGMIDRFGVELNMAIGTEDYAK